MRYAPAVLWLAICAAAGCDEAARPGAGGEGDGGAAPLPDAMRSAPCTRTPEICNGVDDDCDGLVDADDPDLARRLLDDPENCGRCGEACAAPDAVTGCRAGRCVILECAPGFNDYNGRYADGCESDCTITAGGAEACDGRDNDCDGVADEGFDLDTDPDHCGACGRACAAPPFGTVACRAGACVLTGCAPGQVDLDGQPENGCEYACSPTATARVRELCNGLDDDCDGRIDEAADLAGPDEDLCGTHGVCAAACARDADCAGGARCREGVCTPRDIPEAACEEDADCQALHAGLACVAETTLGPDGPETLRRCVARPRGPVCDGAAGYRCARPPDYQPGNEIGRCDGLDNDCDGRVDEDFAGALFVDGPGGRARTCEAGVGECRRTAVAHCSADGRRAECLVEAGPPSAARDDDCDGLDDDCDGRADEDFVDAWVEVAGVLVYAFEASRPGATAEVPGLDLDPDDGLAAYVETRACSRPGVLPWADVTWVEAAAACAAAGARLCTRDEWSRACDGGAGRAFPYGAMYAADACNGGEHDVDPGTPGLQDHILPTGALATCEAGGTYDLSGNLKEWTDDLRDGLRPVRGGGYETNVPEGLRCDQLGDLKPEAFRSNALGFRCCRDL